MSGLQREDYVLRQLKTIAAMLARIAGLRLSGHADEAKAALEQTYTLLLGSQTDLIRRVDSRTAAALLRSPEKVLALAQLLEEEAAQEREEGRSAFLRGRAAELAEEGRRVSEARDARG